MHLGQFWFEWAESEWLLSECISPLQWNRSRWVLSLKLLITTSSIHLQRKIDMLNSLALRALSIKWGNEFITLTMWECVYARNAMVQVQSIILPSLLRKFWVSGECNFDVWRTICCCICAAMALLWKDQPPFARCWATSASLNRLLKIPHSFPHLSLTCNASHWSTRKVNLSGPEGKRPVSEDLADARWFRVWITSVV